MGESVSRAKNGVEHGCLQFNRSCKIGEVDMQLSSESGALLHRELDEALELVPTLAAHLSDPRHPKLTKYSLMELLRVRLYLIMQGWPDQDDADKLRLDAALRIAVSDRAGDFPLRDPTDAKNTLASQPTFSRLNRILSAPENLQGLKDGALSWAFKIIDQLGPKKKRLTLDLDSKFFETYGNQGGTSANAHYHGRGYHPLIAYLAETGSFLSAQLRPGASWTADGAEAFVRDLIREIRAAELDIALRADAGFAGDQILRFLEKTTDPCGQEAPVKYCMRLKNNRRLDELASNYLRRPPGRPPEQPRTWIVEETYRANNWEKPRRVVIVIQENGTLFCDHFFLVTNFSEAEVDGETLWEFYRGRGQMEGDLGQLSSTLNPSLSSSERERIADKKGRTEVEQAAYDERDRRCNEASLLLHLLAFNMMAIECRIMNRIAPQPEVRQTGHVPKENFERKVCTWGWSIMRLREQVLKVAARFSRSSRNILIKLSKATAGLWMDLQKAITAPGFG